jgi:hypothetical protein
MARYLVIRGSAARDRDSLVEVEVAVYCELLSGLHLYGGLQKFALRAILAILERCCIMRF